MTASSQPLDAPVDSSADVSETMSHWNKRTDAALREDPASFSRQT